MTCNVRITSYIYIKKTKTFILLGIIEIWIYMVKKMTHIRSHNKYIHNKY